MKKTVLNVDGMSCEHCGMTVTRALKSLSGVSAAAVDLAAKTVTVDHSPELAIGKIKEAIENSGYTIIS